MNNRASPRWSRRALAIAIAITAVNLVACVLIVANQRDAAAKRAAVAHARAMLAHGRE